MMDWREQQKAGHKLSGPDSSVDHVPPIGTHRQRSGRTWRQSLLVKTTGIFLIGVVFAYSMGALVGWQMFSAAAHEEWRNQARMNTQIASAVLRNIYTYVAVDADSTGQVNRILTDRPIGDDESVLYTGFNPGDVLALIAAQTKNEAWIFSFDATTRNFSLVAAQAVESSEATGSTSFDASVLGAARVGKLATGFATIGDERYYVGLLPIVTSGGQVLGAVVASIGEEADLNRAQWDLVRNSLIVLVLLLGLTSLVVTAIARQFFKPVPILIQATLRIANEQTETPTPFQNRADEIGDLAAAIEVLRAAVVERGHLRDIRDMAVELAHMAHHDPLTGLPNRALLMKTLEEAVASASDGKRFNVLMLDLDRFKAINDTLGHAAGDKLLIATAERLLASLGPGDFAARLGGDEFAIIQQISAEPTEEAAQLAARIIDAIAAGIMLDNFELNVGASIGIACAPTDGHGASQLLKNADLALYRSKAYGRGVFSFFQDGMDMAAHDQHALELDLRLAVARQQFELHYQPIVNLGSGTVCGFEALVRWNHPRLGLIMPDRFIPLAEETGMIVPLGQWIVERACRDAANWPGHLKVAVNLSPVQLRQPGLLPVVEAALETSRLAADRLELEVTETVVLAGEDSVQTLHALRAMGIGIVLDDFGTGYAALSNLVNLPIGKIKIDRGFVADMVGQANSRAIIAAITNLARSLDMEVTAEGVETADQLAILRAAGCTNVQGYYFARPKPLSQLDIPERAPAKTPVLRIL